MLYQRGDRADFAAWGAGWSYDDLFRGGAGRLAVEDLRDPNPLSRAFVAAAGQAGIPANPDYNGARLDGASLARVTQRRGRRWSAADAYLKPARRRPNLDVVTGALAERITFDGRRATGVTVGSIVLTPRSRGAVALRSPDPVAAPVIRPGYLSDPDGEDLRVLLRGIRLARRVCAQPALAAHAGEELEPGPAAQDDEALAAAARATAHGLYHPVGTCRMGDDRMSVVDRTLRVHGVEGLRVADASIMPAVVRGHTNAAAIAIGERAAELVRDGGPPHLLGSWRHGRREAHAAAGTPPRDRDLA